MPADPSQRFAPISPRALDDGTVDHLSLEPDRPGRFGCLEYSAGPGDLGLRWHEPSVYRLDLLRMDAELPAEPEAAPAVGVGS
jgi:hypothetical protein